MALLKITGLWPTKAGTGWTGRCVNTRILVLPVDKAKAKDPSKAPDYELLLSPIDENLPLTPLPSEWMEKAKPTEPASGSTPTATKPWPQKPSHHQKPVAAVPDDHPAFDDEIPFAWLAAFIAPWALAFLNSGGVT